MRRVLVVDDEKENLTMLDLFLRAQGFEPVLCGNGADALRAAVETRPDLAILDVMMPDMDGFALCEELKKSPVTADVPVIFLTARFRDRKDVIRGLSSGAFDYVTKPFDDAELLARITAALRVYDAEQELKRQRDYMTTVLNSISHDLIIVSPDCRIEMANKSFLERRGLTEDDLKAKPCYELSYGLPRQSEECPARQALQGTPVKHRYEYVDQNTHEKRQINIFAFPVLASDGSVTSVIELHEDATREIQRERELLEMNALLESIMEHMSDGIVYIDCKCKVIKQNVAARKIVEQCGVVEDGIIRRIADIDIAEIVDDHSMRGKAEVEKTFVIGKEFFKLESVVAEVNVCGNYILSLTNITKEVESQEEMIQSAKLASIGELAASIAHEISSPITGIIGYGELVMLNRDTLPPKTATIVDKMQRECYRVKGIVENLLRFSRRQSSRDMAFDDIQTTLKEVVGLLSQAASDNDIRLMLELQQDMPLVYCNSGLIQQAVLNLVQNAIDAISAAHKGTRIQIESSVAAGALRIVVRDNGPGVPSQVMEKMFKPFFTTKSQGKGTGLGLSLVYRIVQLHNGTITCDTSDTGAEFTILLPLTNPQMHKVAPGGELATSADRPRRALVVDDDDNLRDYLADILYTFRYAVDEAASCTEARPLLNLNTYDIIILDVKLTDGTGFDLFDHLRREDPEKAASVIFITGDVSLDTKERLRLTGRPFLLKPFNFNDLVSTIGIA